MGTTDAIGRTRWAVAEAHPGIQPRPVRDVTSYEFNDLLARKRIPAGTPYASVPTSDERKLARLDSNQD